jgi:hypothetical protein
VQSFSPLSYILSPKIACVTSSVLIGFSFGLLNVPWRFQTCYSLPHLLESFSKRRSDLHWSQALASFLNHGTCHPLSFSCPRTDKNNILHNTVVFRNNSRCAVIDGSTRHLRYGVAMADMSCRSIFMSHQTSSCELLRINIRKTFHVRGKASSVCEKVISVPGGDFRGT